MYYDPQFYEYTALCHVAKIYGEVLKINYKMPDFALPISKRNELDGFFEKGKMAVEVKSYPLEKGDVVEITDKYQKLGIDNVTIVAPTIKFSEDVSNLRLLEFLPSFEAFSKDKYYGLHMKLPSLLEKELQTGKHNFRYRLAGRSLNKRSRYLNQTDKKIDSVEKLKKEILSRIPNDNPPVKILWSTKRWVSPKDHFYRKLNNLFLGGPIVFDIDGPKVHGAFKPCEISEDRIVCEMCLFFTKRETIKLISILDWAGFENIEVFSSGRSGFHIYVFDDNENRLAKASAKFFEKKIKIDKQVTYSTKSQIAFPMSINGFTGRQLEYIKNIL